MTMTRHAKSLGRRVFNILGAPIRRELAPLRAMLEESRAKVDRLSTRLDNQSLMVARLLADRVAVGVGSLRDVEFRVFSQFGDDGIIQYLVRTLRPETTSFVEFGVEDYLESNTRFLLYHDGWRGLVMDGSTSHIDRLKASPFYWQYDLTAKAAFVTAENVNELIGSAGFTGEIGLLHVDIDGNDYWVWKALDVVTPQIAVIEYNSVLGVDRAITVPYDPGFQRHRAHHSGLYAGASLLALCDLADQKGYAFVGSNSAGNNAYFVRRDRLGPLQPTSAREGYVESQFRESRDEAGRLTFARGEERLALIRGLPVVNTRTGAIEAL